MGSREPENNIKNSTIFEEKNKNEHTCTTWEITQQIYRSMASGVVGKEQKYKNITARYQDSSQVGRGGNQSPDWLGSQPL